MSSVTCRRSKSCQVRCGPISYWTMCTTMSKNESPRRKGTNKVTNHAFTHTTKDLRLCGPSIGNCRPQCGKCCHARRFTCGGLVFCTRRQMACHSIGRHATNLRRSWKFSDIDGRLVDASFCLNRRRQHVTDIAGKALELFLQSLNFYPVDCDGLFC